MPTPISEWGKSFAWWPLARFSAEHVFSTPPSWASDQGGERRCRLCECSVPFADLQAHATSHRREIREYRTRQASEARKQATARLRTVNRLRRGAVPR